MKLMRLAACAVAFAVVGGMVVAEDMDIRSLQAKLAAQEARLNDLQAKMSSGSADTPASILSMKKNAKVTIGGDIDTRYVYDNYKYTTYAAGVGTTTWEANTGDFFVDTAKVNVAAEVNENFDAFLMLNLQNTDDAAYDSNNDVTGLSDSAIAGIAEQAWIRWKNICNSGWGVLVGRNGLVFGMGKPIGMFDAWMQDDNYRSNQNGPAGYTNDLVATHLNYGAGRITQINPYWESCDGKFRFDLSLFQSISARNESQRVGVTRGIDYEDVNYGLGTGTVKLTWKPTEDWTIVGAVANFYADAENGDAFRSYNRAQDRVVWQDTTHSKSNTALHFGVTYTPAAFCQKLTVWGQVMQEYNTGFVDDQDFFSANAGLSYAFTDKFTAFAMGDYLRSDEATLGGVARFGKITGWRSYLGATYNFGNGLMGEAGWSHDHLKGKTDGVKVAKVTGDTIYARLAFSF